MTRFLHLAERAAALPVLLAALTLFAMMAMTFADVVLRSAFNAPIEAATELTRIMMAVIVFSVLPVVSAKGGHIAVDLTDSVFRGMAAQVRDIVLALVCGTMLWWPGMRVIDLAERARSYGDVTEYLAIPQFLIGWFIGIATLITGAALILRGIVLTVTGIARD